jgi:hypothetical protein
MDHDAKKSMILAAAEVGADRRARLSCAKAFALSKQYDISLEEIGLICDEAEIRISTCQLGCFK